MGRAVEGEAVREGALKWVFGANVTGSEVDDSDGKVEDSDDKVEDSEGNVEDSEGNVEDLEGDEEESEGKDEDFEGNEEGKDAELNSVEAANGAVDTGSSVVGEATGGKEIFLIEFDALTPAVVLLAGAVVFEETSLRSESALGAVDFPLLVNWASSQLVGFKPRLNISIVVETLPNALNSI